MSTHGSFRKLGTDETGEQDAKVVLLSGFSDSQVNAFIDYYHTNPELPKAIFATVTRSSRLKRLRDVLNDLEKEAASLPQRG
jgi:hypothetical protein